jgi:hypothetical protein
VFSSLRYCLGDPADKTNLYLALAFLPFGLFFDFMDGRVARWRKKSSMMGQELDSLADLVRVSYELGPPCSKQWRTFCTSLDGLGRRFARILSIGCFFLFLGK